MTAVVVVPRPAKMPGFNHNLSLDEAQSLVSYPQTSAGSVSAAIFSFPTSDAPADLIHGSSWCAPGDAQPFLQDFPTGAAHTGDVEDYSFTSGQTTPKGSRTDQNPQSADNQWNNSRALAAVPRGQAMARIDSNSSASSAISQASQLSSMGVTAGSAAGFPTVSNQALGSMNGMVMNSEAHNMASPLNWPGYGLDSGLNGEYSLTVGDLESLHVAPAQMSLEQDGLPDNSSPGSWDDFSSSISRTSSPATVDDAWMTAALNSNTDAGFICESRESDRKMAAITDGFRPQMGALNDNMALAAALKQRQTEAETPRDDFRYKNAVRQADGLFHCPWEGKPSCNHKPEKLKCNYDKFVDSHLKPYRCKVKSCEGAQFSSTACRLRHEREAHGLHGHGNKPFLCPYEDCDRAQAGNGFPRQWNLRDHMKRVHNDSGPVGGAIAVPGPAASPSLPAAQPTNKGRKRKPEPTEAVPTERKAAQRTPATVNPKPDPLKPLLEQWEEHHRSMQNLFQGLNMPGDSRNLDHLREVQRRSAEMAKISIEINNVQNGKLQTATGRKPNVAGG